MQKFSQHKDYFTKSLTDSFKDRTQGFASGLRVHDIAKPASPREIAFVAVDGLGLHRIWWVGGRYAYVSAHMDGFTDHIMPTIDVSNPERLTLAARCGCPACGARAASSQRRQRAGAGPRIMRLLRAISPTAPGATAG